MIAMVNGRPWRTLFFFIFILRPTVADHDIITITSNRTYVYSSLHEVTAMVEISEEHVKYVYEYVRSQMSDMVRLTPVDSTTIDGTGIRFDFNNFLYKLDFVRDIHAYNDTHYTVKFVLPITVDGMVSTRQWFTARVVVSSSTISGTSNVIFTGKADIGNRITGNRANCVHIIHNEWCKVYNVTAEWPLAKSIYVTWIVMEFIKCLPICVFAVLLLRKKTGKI